MSRLDFSIDGFDPCRAAALAASLPASVRMVEGDALLLDGAGDWPERLTQVMALGARRVILVDPAVVSVEEALIAQVEQAGVSVMLCETHADNPAVAPFSAKLAGPLSAVTITGQGMAPLADMILAQMRLARAVGIEVGDLCDATARGDHALAILQATYGGEGLLLRLNVARSAVGMAHHRLMAHGAAHGACIEIGSATHARPATAFQIGADEAVHQATIYESALRTTLRRAAAGDWPEDAQALRAWALAAQLALAIAAG